MKKNLFSLAFACLLPSFLFSADIAMFRGGPEHTGVIADSPMPKGGYGTYKWRFHTGGKIRSSAALVGGVVDFGCDDRFLYALKSGDGALLWKFKTEGEVQSSPTVPNGLVYFISRDGVFHAVDSKSGKEKWNFPTG